MALRLKPRFPRNQFYSRIESSALHACYLLRRRIESVRSQRRDLNPSGGFTNRGRRGKTHTRDIDSLEYEV
ncbi:hypothetical protein HI914_04497 [Erysiphe necator]|nr:hypothetical protein HI914_04497 [Erysiphe necator]